MSYTQAEIARCRAIPNESAYLPNSAQITEIEDVVKFGGSWQHFDFCLLPKFSSGRNQIWNKLYYVRIESSLRAEMTTANGPKDLVNRCI